MVALVVGLTVAVGLLGILVAGLLRGHAEVLRALHRLGVDLDPSTAAVPVAAPGVRPTPARPSDTDVSDLTGVTPDGAAVSLAVGGVAHDTLVAFLTSGCATCRAFWDAFRGGALDVPGGARLVAVTRGPEAESPGTIAGLAGATPVVMSTAAWEHYDIPYAPYFVYVSGPAGKVMGEGVAAGWEEVKQLVANAVADGTTGSGPLAGSGSLAGSPPPVGDAPPAGDGASGPARGWRARSAADQRRDDEVDRQLRAAGIEPGDPRLHPTSLSDTGRPA
jgi:hypothetical protein